MTRREFSQPPASRLSLCGLSLVNFFLAEVVGVIIPFLSDFLRQNSWSYERIGVVAAAAGFGTLIFQTPAGLIADRVTSRRLLLGVVSILLGACYTIIPKVADHHFLVIFLVFISGMCAAFFAPLLATLALSLVSRVHLDRTMGINQGWNHAGNIAAALVSLAVVSLASIDTVFYVMGAVSLLAAATLLLIRSRELNPDLSREKTGPERAANQVVLGTDPTLSGLLREPAVRTLILCVGLFHLANAPVMPMVALYLKSLGGKDSQVAMVVLLAQSVMVPVAYLAGIYCTNWGRKVVFSVAFLVLPLRIFLYAITVEPRLLLAIQLLDGIGAGIYGVVIALICSDMTRGREGFNTLMGLAETAHAAGGAAGPLMQGFLIQDLGFPQAFIFFSAVAALGAFIFITRMPETRTLSRAQL
ncbi:MAG TPA: MFS transporter [Nitrospiraceae bacterium]|jgi:MFS family permease|nr:MFS transporter [Nitrospiraceae bacterium]